MNNYKNALIQAIRDFISTDEILSGEYLREAATEFVIEHDEDIKEFLRDSINLDDCFSEALCDIDFWDIF